MLFTTESIEIDGIPILRLSYHDIPPRKENIPQKCWHTLRICYIRQGRGIWTIGSKHYDIAAGDIFILNNNEYRAIRTIYPPENLKMMVIDFEPWFIWANQEKPADDCYLKVFFERTESFDNRLNKDSIDARKIIHLMYDVEEEILNKMLEYQQIAKIKLLNILINLKRHYCSVLNSSKPVMIPSVHRNLISNALNYINEHLTDDLSLTILAEVVHMNPYSFSKLFKKYNGIGLSQYISRKRIQLSVELLKNTDMPIIQIANDCGFNSISNYYKTFNNLTGTIPSDYRK